MSRTPPINIRALGLKGVLDEDRFFRMLSEQNNYVDHQTIKDFYMGLVRLATKELRENGVCRFPHLGDFALVKSRDRLGWAGKYQQMITGKYILKFYPLERWRKYFGALEGRSGIEGALDPRQKVLGQDLTEYGIGE